MRNNKGWRGALARRVLRMFGVVSPSGGYPLPPRWALSKLGRTRFYGGPEC